MSRKPHKYAHKKQPHKYLGNYFGKLTPTAKALYDIIFFYGLGGCWMSNATLSVKLSCCRRAIQLARRNLEKKELICSFRMNPKTVTSWARYHPAVRCCEKFFYPGNLKIENPNYDENFAYKWAQKKKNCKKWGAQKLRPSNTYRFINKSIVEV